jgi:hypothetical protein
LCGGENREKSWTGKEHPSKRDVREARIRAKFPRRGNFAEFRFRTNNWITRDFFHYGFGNASYENTDEMIFFDLDEFYDLTILRAVWNAVSPFLKT